MKLAVLIAVACLAAAGAFPAPAGEREGPPNAPSMEETANGDLAVASMLRELELGELRDVLAKNGINKKSLVLLDRDMMDKIGINAGAQLQIEDYLKAKRPAVDTTEKELTNMVTDIMLSDRMAELFAGMIGRQPPAAGASVSRRDRASRSA